MGNRATLIAALRQAKQTDLAGFHTGQIHVGELLALVEPVWIRLARKLWGWLR